MATEAEQRKLRETLAAQRVTWAKYAEENGVKGNLPYKYKVNQPCLRTTFNDFGTEKEQRVQIRFLPLTPVSVNGRVEQVQTIYEIDVPQPSTALDPADEFTAKATAKRAKEIELEIASRSETSPEVQSLRQQLAEQTVAAAALKQQMADLAAQFAALKPAAPAAKSKP